MVHCGGVPGISARSLNLLFFKFGCSPKKLEFVENEQLDEDEEEEDDEINACPQFKKTFFWEASRKSLSSAIWLWLTISDAAERKCLDQMLFGPKIVHGERVNLAHSLKTFMKDTDDQRYFSRKFLENS